MWKKIFEKYTTFVKVITLETVKQHGSCSKSILRLLFDGYNKWTIMWN